MIPYFDTKVAKQALLQHREEYVFTPERRIDVPIDVLVEDFDNAGVKEPMLSELFEELKFHFPTIRENTASSYDEKLIEDHVYEFTIPVYMSESEIESFLRAYHSGTGEYAKLFLLKKALGEPDNDSFYTMNWIGDYFSVNYTFPQSNPNNFYPYISEMVGEYDEDIYLNLLKNTGSANIHQKRGLIVQQPWLDMILSGRKTMDLRSFSTDIRGEIAILHKGKIWGYVDLYDVVGPMSQSEISRKYSKHRVPQSQIGNYKYGWLFKDVRKLKKPRKYDHPQGAQIWVKL